MINNKVNLCFSKKAAGILLAATSFLVMACSENVKELSTLSTNELGITILTDSHVNILIQTKTEVSIME